MDALDRLLERSACPVAGSSPQKPNTCRSQRPSPDGMRRSQRPRRPNSWAMSSSSPWRRAWAARKRVELTSAEGPEHRARPTRLARARRPRAASRRRSRRRRPGRLQRAGGKAGARASRASNRRPRPRRRSRPGRSASPPDTPVAALKRELAQVIVPRAVGDREQLEALLDQRLQHVGRQGAGRGFAVAHGQPQSLAAGGRRRAPRNSAFRDLQHQLAEVLAAEQLEQRLGEGRRGPATTSSRLFMRPSFR